uniref:Serine/threonine-protein phosphatase 7 long form homolog n=1 Tax=Nicotiana tabacum TaxID=4097 RepID=A0A1S4CVF2_TOBAC|nr:PREDICTED: serine/threonine-protein phosphatase 7 long form homolog [Nicotiana tabacum]
MDTPIYPSPYSLEILVLQGDHRSAYIWKGELLSQILRARSVDDLWDFLRHRDLHERVVHRLQDTGFYRIIKIGRIQVDWALITALIERWRPETHTFHLPIGEATITLPQDETASSGASRLTLTPIRQYLEVLHPDIIDDTVELLDELPYYNWGVAVLGYMYRQMCRASMSTRRDFQPPRPQLPHNVAPPFLPLARRDVLDLLEGAHFIWTPYNDDLIASLPAYYSVDRLIWSTSAPLICLDIVEHHASEWVLRQFGRPQYIPRGPIWEPTHYQRDDRYRADDAFTAWLVAQIHIWDHRDQMNPPPPTQIQEVAIQRYISWYWHVTQSFIGNPIHQASGRYVPYAGRHEALAIRLHTVYQMGLQMQDYVGDPVDALQDYSRRFVELASRTLQRAREDQRLAHMPDYVEPEL